MRDLANLQVMMIQKSIVFKHIKVELLLDKFFDIFTRFFERQGGMDSRSFKWNWRISCICFGREWMQINFISTTRERVGKSER